MSPIFALPSARYFRVHARFRKVPITPPTILVIIPELIAPEFGNILVQCGTGKLFDLFAFGVGDIANVGIKVVDNGCVGLHLTAIAAPEEAMAFIRSGKIFFDLGSYRRREFVGVDHYAEHDG